MKTIEVKGHLRESLGSKSAKQLRREGQVPCVVYGGSEVVHFYGDERELNKLLYTPNVYLVTLNLGSKTIQAVVREAQFHPVSDHTIHMDFTEVANDKTVNISMPVRLTGSAAGVKSGGTLKQNAKKLKVRGVVSKLPDEIMIDVTELRLAQSIKVGDLKIEGLEIAEAPNRVVVEVKSTRKAVADEGAAAAPAKK